MMERLPSATGEHAMTWSGSTIQRFKTVLDGSPDLISTNDLAADHC
jgi:hypothetical protein